MDTGELSAVPGERELKFKFNPFISGVISIIIAMLAFTAVNVWLTVHAVNNSNKVNRQQIEASNQAMCPILEILHGVYLTTPPTTVAGKKLADAVAEAIGKYECTGTD